MPGPLIRQEFIQVPLHFVMEVYMLEPCCAGKSDLECLLQLWLYQIL
jgi:hypothetical protein